jgi:hypothetical protein
MKKNRSFQSKKNPTFSAGKCATLSAKIWKLGDKSALEYL